MPEPKAVSYKVVPHAGPRHAAARKRAKRKPLLEQLAHDLSDGDTYGRVITISRRKFSSGRGKPSWAIPVTLTITVDVKAKDRKAAIEKAIHKAANYGMNRDTEVLSATVVETGIVFETF